MARNSSPSIAQDARKRADCSKRALNYFSSGLTTRPIRRAAERLRGTTSGRPRVIGLLHNRWLLVASWMRRAHGPRDLRRHCHQPAPLGSGAQPRFASLAPSRRVYTERIILKLTNGRCRVLTGPSNDSCLTMRFLPIRELGPAQTRGGRRDERVLKRAKRNVRGRPLTKHDQAVDGGVSGGSPKISDLRGTIDVVQIFVADFCSYKGAIALC